ncbi:MAG: DUF2510 domain-containing protein [Solirubrobacterales bacterium]
MEQSSAPAEGQQTPAGWYKDPNTGHDRYWDGAQWTEQQVEKQQDGLVIAGYITSFLLWPVGLIIGIIVASRGRTGHGFGIIAAAILFGILGILYVTSMS